MTSGARRPLRAVPAGSRAAVRPLPPARSRTRVHRARQARRLAGLARFALFLFLIFVAVWAGVRVANATSRSDALDGRPYQVQPGDTLWQIAAAEYGDSLDLRAVVYEIREANELSDALLQPGQELTLPYIEP